MFNHGTPGSSIDTTPDHLDHLKHPPGDHSLPARPKLWALVWAPLGPCSSPQSYLPQERTRNMGIILDPLSSMLPRSHQEVSCPSHLPGGV